jgi:hypothetical protein
MQKKDIKNFGDKVNREVREIFHRLDSLPTDQQKSNYIDTLMETYDIHIPNGLASIYSKRNANIEPNPYEEVSTFKMIKEHIKTKVLDHQEEQVLINKEAVKIVVDAYLKALQLEGRPHASNIKGQDEPVAGDD